MSTSLDATKFDWLGDARMVGRQIFYEQLNFWLNPVAAIFTIGFSVFFLILIASSAGTSRSSELGGALVIQYYVPVFIAYGIMSTCFNSLATALIVRREMGLLKRLRLSPLPTWAFLGAIFVNAVIISFVQVVLLLLIGKFGYSVVFPHNFAPFLVALVVGAASFTAIGVAVSTLIPNQEAAGPIISIVFFVLLFLSGLWYPLSANSALAKISSWFPIRHMIVAMYVSFNVQKGVSGWSWHDIFDLAIWGAIASVVALRRWSWAPRRSDASRNWRTRFGSRRTTSVEE
jgi:ABC-2 type transport system permease protein